MFLYYVFCFVLLALSFFCAFRLSSFTFCWLFLIIMIDSKVSNSRFLFVADLFLLLFSNWCFMLLIPSFLLFLVHFCFFIIIVCHFLLFFLWYIYFLLSIFSSSFCICDLFFLLKWIKNFSCWKNFTNRPRRKCPVNCQPSYWAAYS